MPTDKSQTTPLRALDRASLDLIIIMLPAIAVYALSENGDAAVMVAVLLFAAKWLYNILRGIRDAERRSEGMAQKKEDLEEYEKLRMDGLRHHGKY